MGAKLVAFYSEAEKLGGMHAKLKLAGLTKMTSSQANTIDDSRELVALFEKSIRAIRDDAAKSAEAKSGQLREVTLVAGDPAVLRKHIQLYLDLMSQRALVLGDVAETVRRVTETAADALDVARVSVWWVDDGRTKITCADLFEKAERKHSSGVELFAKDFPPYFVAMLKEKTIAAHDAHTDPRTSCFSSPYLKPLGINSMLDVPIWVNNRMVGVICHEHVGPARSWNSDEEKFAYLMSSFVALAGERPRS